MVSIQAKASLIAVHLLYLLPNDSVMQLIVVLSNKTKFHNVVNFCM